VIPADRFRHLLLEILRIARLLFPFIIVFMLFEFQDFTIFARYDTRTNQDYEGPGDRPEEVSLTLITDNIRSARINS